MSRASRTQHSRGGVMSGDNPFSASDSDSELRSELRFLFRRFTFQFRTLIRFRTSSTIPTSELPRKQSKPLGTRHQGTGVSRPISLVSTERWPWLRSRTYIVQAH
jgi:hypothetical protein